MIGISSSKWSELEVTGTWNNLIRKTQASNTNYSNKKSNLNPKPDSTESTIKNQRLEPVQFVSEST